MIALFGGAFVAAIVGAPHCLGMCGGLVCAAGGTARDQAAHHVGRIATYAVLGAVAGAVGFVVPGPPWVATALAGVLLVVFAASLAGLVPEPKIGASRLARAGAALIRRPGLGPKLGFGIVNGLLPCGLVYATLAVPVALGDPLLGAAAMALFGLGTGPALAAAALGLRRVLGGRLWARRALAAGVLLAGLWGLAQRHVGHAAHAEGAHAEGAAEMEPSCH